MKNNFITKIIGATLAFAMMIGGAVGINTVQQAKEVNADQGNVSVNPINSLTGKSGTSYISTASSYTAGATIYANNWIPNATQPQIKVNQGNTSSLNASNFYMYNSTAFADHITKITVTFNTSVTKNYFQIHTSNSAALTSNQTYDTSKSGTLVSGNQYKWEYAYNSSIDYFRFGCAKNGGAVKITEFTVYYGQSSAPNKTATTTEITSPENKDTLDLALTPTDTVQLSANVTYESGEIDDPSITWASSNTNVATVNETTGLVTPVAKGDATITASYAGDDTYADSSAQKVIHVINSAVADFVFSSIASENNWQDSTIHTPVVVNGVTLTANGGGNNGRYHTNDSTWRMYTGGSLTITPPSGKSISAVSSTPSNSFAIASGGTSASASFTETVKFKSIIVTLAPEKVLESISASVTNTSRVWRTNDVVHANDLTVVPHYTDGTDGAAITDGTEITVTNGTLLNVGSNTVNVAFRNKTTTVSVNALSSTIVEWELSGQIGETVKSTAYDLSGLTLRGWYDNEKTDEASAAVVSGFTLVANPTTAGATADENNTIEVKVYANSDTGHENCLKTFSNVAAPIIAFARGTAENPYTVTLARNAIDSLTTISDAYVSGIISEVASFNDQYNSITYRISDDGTTNNQLEVYSGKGLNGDDFESVDDIEVGARVIVKGNLQKHNETYQFNYNSQLISYLVNAESRVARLDSQASLSYRYNQTGGYLDKLTGALTGISGTNYTEWSNKIGASGAVYAGQSAGNYSSIQLRSDNNNSGVITTTSGGNATKVTIAWNSNTSNGRTVNVYGRDTAYTAATELYGENPGTLIGTIKKGTSTELTISDEYQFIGIRSASGAMYIDSISIQWGEPANYTFSDVAIRFGGSITPELWEELDTNEHNIAGFGVAWKKAGTFEGLLKNNITNVETADDQGFYKLVSAKAEGHPDLVNGKYIWNFYLRIPTVISELYDEQYLDDNITAVAYIKLKNGEVVYLKETTASVKSLAQALLDDNTSGYNNSSLHGSLNYLANLTF